jgi:hypothetical protein
MDLAFVHPTYALFVAIPLAGFAVVRALVTTEDLRDTAVSLAAFAGPVLLVFAWLSPIVSETRSHTPSAAEKTRGLAQYAGDLVVHSPSSYHIEPSLVVRTGAVAVAALVLVPLAALAARRRWSSLVLGGMVPLLALELAPYLFPRFSDLVSLSQSRRAAGFVPFAFAFAGGFAVLARALRLFVLPAALAAGIVLQELYPGDFELRSPHGGPAVATWIALWGALAGIVAAVFLARSGRGRYEDTGWLAGAAGLLFVLPVAVYGFTHWNHGPRHDPLALTPGLVAFLRSDVPERAVVYGDLETSYRISAYAPVYVANAAVTHVADTKPNHPYARRADLNRFLRTGDLAIPRSYGAGWLVLRRKELRRLRGDLVYRDGRYRVFRLRG